MTAQVLFFLHSERYRGWMNSVHWIKWNRIQPSDSLRAIFLATLISVASPLAYTITNVKKCNVISDWSTVFRSASFSRSIPITKRVQPRSTAQLQQRLKCLKYYWKQFQSTAHFKGYCIKKTPQIAKLKTFQKNILSKTLSKSKWRRQIIAFWKQINSQWNTKCK